MKRLLILPLLPIFVFITSYGQAQDKALLPVRVGGKYGFIDTTGTMIISPRYDELIYTSDKQLAIIGQNGRYGVVNLHGREIIACTEENIEMLPDSYLALKKNGRWALANKNGKLLTDYLYDKIAYSPYRHFNFRIGELTGLMDRNGKAIIPATYDYFSFYDNTYIFTYRDGLMGLCDSTGRVLLPPISDDISMSVPEIAIYDQDDKRGYISLWSGKNIPAIWADLDILSRGYIYNGSYTRDCLIEVLQNGKKGLYNLENDSLILPPEYDGFETFNSCCVLTLQDHHYGLTDRMGKLILPNRYKEISPIGDDWLKIRERNDYGVSDRQGNILIRPQFNDLVYLRNNAKKEGLFVFFKNGKAGLIRTDSTILLEAVYDNISDRQSGFLVIKQGEKYGVISLDGEVLQAARFDRVDYMVEGTHIIVMDQKVGLLNRDGKMLADAVYDKITVVDKTYKAYRDSILEIIWLDDQYQIIDKVVYEDIPSVHLNNPNARIYQWNSNIPSTTGLNTNMPPSYRFFLSEETNKWGVIEANSNRVIIKPKFDKFSKTKIENFYYVYVNTDTINYNIGDCRFYSMKVCGLVDMASAFLVVEPQYLSINLYSDRDYNWSAILIDSSGKMGYANRYGAFNPGYTFISRLRYNEARVNYGGTLGFSTQSGLETEGRLRDFLDGFTCRLRYYDKHTRDMSISEYVMLQCTDGQWGNLKMHVRTPKVQSYQWMSGAVFRDYYIIKQDGQKKLLHNGILTGVLGIDYENFLDTIKGTTCFTISQPALKYGFINEKGRLLTHLIYDYVRNFKESRAAVMTQRQWGFLNTKGDIIIPQQFSEVKDFSEGLVAVKGQRKWGYLGPKGDTLIDFVFNKAGDFHNGLALVRKSSKNYYIDDKGNPAFPELSIEKAKDFNQAYAMAGEKNRWGIINTQGLWVVKPKYDRIYHIDSALNIAVVGKGNRKGLINLQGEKITPMRYDQIRQPSEGLIAARNDNRWGMLTPDGSVVIPFDYIYLGDFSNGRAVARAKSYYGALNREGVMVIPMEYRRLEDFRGGISIARPDGQYDRCLVDTNGNKLMTFTHGESILYPSEGKISVGSGLRKYVYMDFSGVRLWDIDLDVALGFEKSLARVCREKKWGLLNEKGEWIFPTYFDSIRNFQEGFAAVMVSRKTGVADSYGRILIAPEYHGIEPGPFLTYRVWIDGEMGYINRKGNIIWQPSE